MYYKVMMNARVIDVLDGIEYVRYQKKHRILLLCDEADAQGILSSDKESAYHLCTLEPFPVDSFPTVTIEEISRTEYLTLLSRHLKTAEEIAEDVLAELIERGVF